jgi:hypothetical protein
MFKEKVEAAKAKVQGLLDTGFIREVTYPLVSKCGDGPQKRTESGKSVQIS